MSDLNPNLPKYHPDQPEQSIPPLPGSIPDPPDEHPTEDQVIPKTSENLPPVVLGCATFGYGIYADTENFLSDMSCRTVRYALRSGINAFDTSPWYNPSEQVLGQALAKLASEFPRSSYKILTKVGKYGPSPPEHMYDEKTVRKSVENSLRRLKTDYLDVVYLHDVEFVTPYKVPAGHHLESPPTDLLTPPIKSLGPGEDNVLEGLRTLRALQAEGTIRAIGIAGYTLPVLLRIALLAASTDIGPLDILQTYSHETLQCSTLSQGYLAKFEEAGVKQVMNAAPLAMGVLTSAGAADWHPLRMAGDKSGAYDASREAVKWCKENETTLEEVAVQSGFKELRSPNGVRVPTVIGCKNVDEVRRTVTGWRKANLEPEAPKMAEAIAAVKKIFEDVGAQGYSYLSPPDA
ncbi:NADP-dependent oxidoreductase domain-containing protein [Kockovaella imperatae]|uniref:NADP-dependent oxidoreductase domain-containing protein n=1 Tax=Kockovaella imperatae TaxID=4999 RepID=A0A1Y1URW4_9TREE|nr:NADP-dependent oxidoreductase domain-containing protein [Kockovaella imperatae]ORX40709.1 NADP-dependent oxidoreductase domain-containing protein [Kockovaella imperatae]